MLAEGSLESTRIKKMSYSQVDIAPTLLDLIGVQYLLVCLVLNSSCF